MRNNTFLFISIFFNSCGLIRADKAENHSYYADINVFNMNGVGLLKTHTPRPPCFEVDSIASEQIRLTTWYPKIGSSSSDYIYSDKCWSTTYSMFADTISLLVYKYVGNATIIALQYLDDSSKNKLKAASIYKDSVETEYRFKNYYLVNPSCKINFDGISDTFVESKTVKNYRVRSGVLEVIIRQSLKLEERKQEDTLYYKVGGHSIFWWMEFGR